MQPICPKCGDPVEPDEIFCDKCGTKVGSDMSDQNQYQPPTPNAYQNQYQTPAPNAHQNQYQIPTPNQYHTPMPGANQGQYSYIPGQQQNVPPYTPPVSYQPPPYAQYQKPKTGGKVLKIIFITVSVIAILIVALGIISVLTEKKDDKTADNNKKPAASDTTKPAVNDSNKQSTDTSKPAAGKMLVTWDGNIDVNTNYNASEKKIYVDYSIIMKNVGSGNAQNINIYLDPETNDENAKYLGMKPKTIVNYDGIVKEIGAGKQQPVKTKFFYNNVEPSAATQNNLQDIANRYLKIPVLIEWEENGKKFTDRKIPN